MIIYCCKYLYFIHKGKRWYKSILWTSSADGSHDRTPRSCAGFCFIIYLHYALRCIEIILREITIRCGQFESTWVTFARVLVITLRNQLGL